MNFSKELKTSDIHLPRIRLSASIEHQSVPGNIKIFLDGHNELSTDGAVSLPDCPLLDSVGGCIYSKAITLKRITFTFYALFTLSEFSNQFSRILATIKNKWYYR